MSANVDWTKPEFSGPTCRFCGLPRATASAFSIDDLNGNYEGSEVLCWESSEESCGQWMTRSEAYDLAVRDVVTWLRGNNDLKRCWTLADMIEAGAHFGKAERK